MTRSRPTTSHRRARSRPDSPAGTLPRRARRRAARVQLLRRAAREPRGHDARHVREHPAAERARAGHRGLVDDAPAERRGDVASSMRPSGTAARACRSLVLAGKEYGSGSSRDWAAKGPSLLGVRLVIAESYERIHRSNLVGMGIVPLQYEAGDSASLGLDGTERCGTRVHRRRLPGQRVEVAATATTVRPSRSGPSCAWTARPRCSTCAPWGTNFVLGQCWLPHRPAPPRRPRCGSGEPPRFSTQTNVRRLSRTRSRRVAARVPARGVPAR